MKEKRRAGKNDVPGMLPKSASDQENTVSLLSNEWGFFSCELHEKLFMLDFPAFHARNWKRLAGGGLKIIGKGLL
jgi:hypothetical protein